MISPDPSSSPPPPSRRRWLALWGAVGAVVLAVAVVALASALLSDEFSRSRLDLVANFTTQAPDPSWPYLDAQDRTGEVCGKVGCLQAVGNEYLTLLKFRSSSEASAYAKAQGEAAQLIDPLVIHFDGRPMGAEKRAEVVETVNRINSSSED